MSQSRSDGVTATWTSPQCPFAIEYALPPLDDIRLAVIDAFFSLPRGGAEIGGVLLGNYENRRLLIRDCFALECEHAFGPGFTLSGQDRARLEALLASARQNSQDRRPVGWYHSHTRSEIFLSEADLEIHNRYFPEPFQVALVLRPHTFQPMRAGFFFRDSSGAIDPAGGQHEFILEPLPAQPLPASAAIAGPPPPGRRSQPMPALEQSSAPQPGPIPAAAAAAREAAQPEPPPADLPTPRFLDVKPPTPKARSSRWLGLLLLSAAAVGGAAAYQSRQLWIPRVSALYTNIPPDPPIGLNTLDSNGQLQIHWNRNSALLRDAANATLSIVDGTARQVIPLDAMHLQTGIFTYARHSERVDVAITLSSGNGRTLRQATTFLGALPAPPAPALPANDDLRTERDTLLQQNTKLKLDLRWQTIQVKRLQRSVQDLRNQLQRRRPGNQNPGIRK